MKKNQILQLMIRYGLGGILFTLGAIFTGSEGSLFSCGLFFALGILEGILIFRESRSFLDFRFVLTLSWISSIGLSSLKLSSLQTSFTPVTWACLGIFYFVFLGVFDGCRLLPAGKLSPLPEPKKPAAFPVKKLEICIYLLAALGFLCFFIESVVFEFDYPFFAVDTPHAYTSFHVTGIHYFVMSLCLVPVLSVALWVKSSLSLKKKTGLLFLNLLCFLVPVLLLSKLQLAFTLFLTAIAWVLLKKPSKKVLLIGALGLFLTICLFFVLIVQKRQYPEGYLQEVFSFKNPETPGTLQYVYMYIVNNLENFNQLVICSTAFTWGIRCSFPFLALTGLKFLPAVNELLSGVPYYFTSENLTTTSVIYDAYGDFGLPGVLILALLSGLFCILIQHLMKQERLLGLLLYCQMTVYLFLAFFATWFSNPTTWFYFAVSVAAELFINSKFGGKHQHEN